jgi:UDP-N-acetylmuramoylalanine--D-glutamate ligase
MILESARPEIREPIGVVGYGVEGRSTCAWLLARGFRDITVFDRKAPEGLDDRVHYAAPAPGGSYLAGLGNMRTVFRSAGVRADQGELAAFAAAGGTLTSQVGLAFALAGRDRIIGVTGTVGKGTCCSILHAMLTEAGIPVRLGGNIGVPALDLTEGLGEGEWLLLELSSFQLSALPVSPKVAVVLRTTSEHLDWHPTRDEYWLHKGNLAKNQGPGDLLVHCADAPGSAFIAGLGGARRISYGPGAEDREVGAEDREVGAAQDIVIAGGRLEWVTRGFTLSLAETRLKGAFNLENLAAAAAVALELGADPDKVKAAAARFEGLEHRLEFVREHRGIAWYNDSYATRPEASIGAVKALADAPLGLVLGGSEKHADFSELAAAVAAAPQVKAVALIGQTADRLRTDLLAAGVAPALLRPCATLEEAVQFLAESVGRGAVALSPACASFGLFENYKERGKAFKRLVRSLT